MRTTERVGDVTVFENRQPVIEAKFINKSSLFILLLGIIRRLELKPISEQKVEHIFVAPPYCQNACYLLPYFSTKSIEFQVVMNFLYSVMYVAISFSIKISKMLLIGNMLSPNIVVVIFTL